MPRKFFRKYLPSRESVRSHRLIAKFGGFLHRHPNLWHLNRQSVSGGVAVGLFCGLIPGPLQMGGALLLVLLFRKNIPVALVTTLYTNPFTIVPLYLLAYWLGTLLLGMEHVAPKIAELDWQLIVSLGKPLVVGLLALALALAAVGYVAVALAWRFYIVMRWARR